MGAERDFGTEPARLLDHNGLLVRPVWLEMGSRPGFPTPFDIRRPLVVLAVLAALLGPVLSTLWVSTPDVSDARARVQRDTRSHGVVLLARGAVPDLLAKAVVAIED